MHLAPRDAQHSSSTDGSGSRKRFALGLLIIALLSVGVRYGVWRVASPVGITGDEVRYLRAAVQLRQGEGYGVDGQKDARWPPAQSFLLSRFLSEDPDSVQDLQSLSSMLIGPQLLFGALLVLLTMLLGQQLFDSRTGLVAGLFAVFYPTFVGYSHYFWSETLLLVLLTGALTLAVRTARRQIPRDAVLAGLLFGAAGLTREIAILLAIGTSFWWLAIVPRPARRKTAALSLLMLACCALVIAPWTLRNYRLLDRFVPVSTVFWMGMREGNTIQGEDWLRPDREALTSFRAAMASAPDELQGVELARSEALQLIRKAQPTWIFKKLARNSALLFSPDSFVFKKISRGAYGEPRLWAVRLVLVSTLLAYIGITIGGLFGIAACADRGKRLLPIMVLVIVAAVHVLAQASSRYRLPMMPLLMAYAAAWVTTGLPVRRLDRKGLVLCALFLVVLLGWCVPYFWTDAVELWASGTYADPWRP